MNKIITKLLLGVLFVFTSLNALAQPSAYSFAGSTGTYTAITGTTLGAGAIGDDVGIGNLPIGFTFNYNSTAFTVFGARSNGLIELGQTAATLSGFSANALASTANCVAPLWDDNNTTGGSIIYATTGTAPNRVLTVQYTGMHVGGTGSSTNPTINLQILLYETSNQIQFIYGATSAAFSSTTASIGISGNSGNFLSVTPTSATAPYATTSNITENTNISAATFFPTGTTYTFTPPPPCVPPTSLAASITVTPGVNSAAGSFTAAPPTAPSGYLVVRTATNVQPAPVSGTTYTVGTNAIGYIEYVNTVAGSWTSTGLAASTPYYYWVFSYNSGCTGAPSYSASATTTSITTTACSLSGTKSVGPGGDYPTLKAAVDAAVLSGVTGPLTLELNAAYGADDAVFPIVLGPVPCASATNTITIRPAAGAGAKTITGSNTTAIFDINGGNYWRIDGRQGGAGSSKDLTISNTSTATGGVAIRYINEASNNIVNYSVLKGLFASTTSGVVLFSTTTGANGNDNNTIDNCDIDGGAAAAASPTLVATNGIYGAGTTTTLLTYNNGEVISNCNIFNFFNAATSSTGILAAGGISDWTIQNNKFYQTSPRVFTATALIYSGITFSNNGANNLLISGNTIGFATNTGTGVTNISGSSNMVYGISVFPGTTTVSTVSNNNITAITQNTSRASTTLGAAAFYGIRVGASGLVNISGNTIGSLDNSTSIGITHTSTTASTAPSTGIYTGGTATQNITNNNIGSITVTQTATQSGGLRGIQINVATGIITNVTGNTVGGTSAASGLTLTGGLSQLIGIHAILGVNNISNNTVRYLTNQGSANTGTGSSAQLIGISNNSTDAGVSTISQNNINNINSSSTAAINFQAAGFYNNGSTTGNAIISRNFIHTILTGSTGTAALHYGMNFGGGICNVFNNIVAIGTGMTNNIGIFGINDGGTTNNYYFNSVYVGGSANGNLNTFAFNSGVSLNTRKFQNNIFANARTNAGAGRSYAVSVAGSAPNPAGLTIGNNDYWVSGAGTVLGRFNSADVLTLAAWQTAVGQDAQSVNIDPTYVNPVAATPDLHITSPNPSTTLESAALAISGITNDFDGQTRPGTPSGSNNGAAPDIGADEFDGLNPNICTGTPAQGGTASSSAAALCAGNNITLTLTAPFTTGPGIGYQWQYAPTTTTSWVDIAGANATVSVATLPAGLWDVRCIVKCVPSGLFAASNTITGISSTNCTFNITKANATFTSISGSGTSMTGWRNGATNTDDNLSTSQPIGFSFPYKGTNYSNFSASTNGYLTFNVGTAATGGLSSAYGYDNTQFTSTTGTLNSLAVYYDDLVCAGNPGTAAGLASSMKYQVDGTAPNRVLTVEWIGMETFNNAGPNLNFQVKLYETTGQIEYVYGTMEGFNGTADYGYSHTIGVNNATVSATPTVLELQTQQIENVQNFSNVPKNNLGRVPDCNIKYSFVPAVYGGAGAAPGVPANDEPAGAVTLSVNASPCVGFCGTYYTSKNATASAGITVCGAASPGTADDDVWFKFIATTTQQVITVRGGGGYDPVLQLFSDAGTTSITCVNATGNGATETITATGLTAGNTYYVRVYHSGTGSNNATTALGNGGVGIPDFSICINEVIPPPANDNICGAVTLTAGLTCSPVSGTTIAATASPQAVCGGTPDDDVWYKWTAVLATDSIKVQSAAGFNAHVEIFSSSDNTCTGTLTSLACINATSTGGLEVYAPTGLVPGNTYFVRVYHSASGTGTGLFTICALAPAPPCVTGTSPANGTSVDATVGTSLTWSAAAGATGYDVYFDTNNPPTTLVSSNQPGLTYATGILTVNQVYYWRIISRNGAGTSSGCSVQNINTNPPACIPAPTSPANASNICLSVSATTLSWPASPGATGYDVYFDPGAGPATTQVSSNQAGLTFNAGVLTAGQYAWRIIPRNNNGAGSGCNNWTFTVNALPTVNITPTGPVSICPPTASQVLTLGSTTAASPTYQWKKDGVNIGGATTTSYTATASGTYTLVVTDGVTTCSNTSNAVVVVFNPQPTVSVSPATITACSGATTAITATASVGYPNIKITEVTLNRTGTGATSPYPAFVTGADLVEISNVSASPVDVSGLTVGDYNSNSSTANHPYTIPASTVIPANGVMVLHLGTGTDDAPNRYFNTGGASDSWFSGDLMGVVLKSGSTIVDAVGLNSGYVFNAGTGVTASDWSGFAPSPSTFAGTIRSSATDNNTGADWVQSNTPSPLQTIGTYNGGYTPVSGGVTYLWSPTTSLFADAGLSTPYTNQDQPTVWANPTANITYTVQVTSGAGCTNNATSAITVGNTWIGGTTDAATAGNWSCGIPTGTTDVIIPTTPSGGNMPVLTANLDVRDIKLQPSATIDLGGQTFTINGVISGTGLIRGSAASNLTLAGAAGTVNFDQTSAATRSLNNLTLNTGATAVLGNALDVYGTVALNTASLNMNAKAVTLKSNATNTARIANLTGSTLSGANNVTMERYIKLRLGGTGRAYRLLTPTVNTSGSINANWMEGGLNTAIGTNVDPLPGYGTQITGAGGNANGFDKTATNAPSLYNTANGVTPTYTAIGSTSGTLNAKTGYFMYVRGDRSQDMTIPLAVGMPTSATTLRATGNILQGTQTTFTNAYTGGGALNLVTNPYPSPIDWSLVQPASSGITGSYTYWDANIGTRGGFATVTTAGVSTPATSATQIIQSGQAFFVESDGTTPAVSIQESHKVAGNNNDVFIVPPPPVESFRTELYFTEPNGFRRIADGAIALYDNSYSAAVDSKDAKEINNWDENIAIARDGKHLAIESRPVIEKSDDLPIFMNNMKKQQYEFEFTPQVFTNTSLKAELVDNFLGTRTLLSVTGPTVVSFSITDDPASKATDRFKVVFGQFGNPAGVDAITIKASQLNGGVQVDWASKTETDMARYEVERSTYGTAFVKAGTTAAIGNSSNPVNYNWFDASPNMGTNFYRIKGIDKAGNVRYSEAVRVLFGKGEPSIVVYPNPLQGNTFKIDMYNLVKGGYTLNLYNMSGQLVYTEQLQHDGSQATKTINLKGEIGKGTYQLQLVGSTGFKTTQKIIKN